MYLFRSVTPEAREISFKVYDEDSNKKGIKKMFQTNSLLFSLISLKFNAQERKSLGSLFI